jgi:hypothetical protein
MLLEELMQTYEGSPTTNTVHNSYWYISSTKACMNLCLHLQVTWSTFQLFASNLVHHTHTCIVPSLFTGCPRLPPGGISALQPRLTVVRKPPSSSNSYDSGAPGGTPVGSFKVGKKPKVWGNWATLFFFVSGNCDFRNELPHSPRTVDS